MKLLLCFLFLLPGCLYSQYNNLIGLEMGSYFLDLNTFERNHISADFDYYNKVGVIYEFKKNTKSKFSMLTGIQYNSQRIGYIGLYNDLIYKTKRFGSLNLGINYSFITLKKHNFHGTILCQPYFNFSDKSQIEVSFKIAIGYGYLKRTYKNRKLIIRLQPTLSFIPVKKYYQEYGYFFNNSFSYGLELHVLFGK